MTTPQNYSSSAAAAIQDAAPAAVLHSHHYHAALLRALYEAEGLDAAAILREAACAAPLLAIATPKAGGDWEWLASALREAGLGDPNVTGLQQTGFGTVQIELSHFARAWLARYPAGKRPVCSATAGLLESLLTPACGMQLQVVETRCAAAGANSCAFDVRTAGKEGGAGRLHAPPEGAVSGWGASTDPCSGEHGKLFGDSLFLSAPVLEDAPGGPFAQMAPEFYASVAHLFSVEVPRRRGSKFGNVPAIMLTEAAHRNGFRLLGEILSSREWQDDVSPELRSDAAKIPRLLEVMERLGWGRWRVRSFVPGERLIVRIDHSYEAIGHERILGLSEEPCCTVARGAAAALMNLFYLDVDPALKPLSVSHYNALFRSPHTYRAVETRCRARGESCCEIVVNPLTG